MIETSLFPYESFSVRLDLKEENKIAWFKDDVDLQKYLDRHKMDKRKVKVTYRDGEPTSTSKRVKNKVRQGTTKTDSGSATTTRGSTKSVDSSRNTSGNLKTKPKSKPKPKSK